MKKLRSEAKNLIKLAKGKSRIDKERALDNLMEINAMTFEAKKIISLAQEAKASVSENGVRTTSSSNMIEYAREYERADRMPSTTFDWIMEAAAAEAADALVSEEMANAEQIDGDRDLALALSMQEQDREDIYRQIRGGKYRKQKYRK